MPFGASVRESLRRLELIAASIHCDEEEEAHAEIKTGEKQKGR